jgi:hypothetical protein
MGRALLSLVLAPVLASLMFGAVAIIVAPMALLLTGVLATPLFFLFKKWGWLRWWHACAVGLLCSVAFSGLFAVSVSPSHVEAFAVRDTLGFLGVGLSIALLFWWLGLFRNSSFPAVPVSMPWSMLALVPIVTAGYLLYRALDPVFVQGRVIEVSGEVPMRQVTVHLSSGAVVPTRFFDDSRPTSAMMNQCWSVMKYWSLKSRGEAYMLESPVGNGVDSC